MERKENVQIIISSIRRKRGNKRTCLLPSTQKHNIQWIIAAYPPNVTQLKKKSLMALSGGSACSFSSSFFLMAYSISSEFVRNSD